MIRTKANYSFWNYFSKWFILLSFFELDQASWEAFCAWGRGIDSSLDGFTNGGKTQF